MHEFFDRSTLKERALEVFLCHSHADRAAVRALYSRLKKDGVEAWLDKESLSPGQAWEHEIRQAILKSDKVIVCLSRHFKRQTGYRQEELKLALEKANVLPEGESFIIPARLEMCELPEALRGLQRVDLFEAGGYKKLKSVLHSWVEPV